MGKLKAKNIIVSVPNPWNPTGIADTLTTTTNSHSVTVTAPSSYSGMTTAGYNYASGPIPGTRSPSGHVYTEYAGAVTLDIMVLTSAEVAQIAMRQIMDSYAKCKAKHFPSWQGFPEIKQNMASDPLRRFVTIDWHVVAPDESVPPELPVSEDELWNS